MKDIVARLNIERYCALLLDADLDKAERQTIVRLLAEEQAKLADLESAEGGNAEESRSPH